MNFLENGLDKTTGFCVGLTAVAFGLPAGASELAVGAAGLIGFVLGKKKFGPECERVREKIQKKVLKTYKKKITGSDGNWQADADLIAADKSLQECLGDCMIERSQLVGAAVSPKGFSEKAVDIVMEQLAANYPDQFGEKRTDDLPYNFARDVVSAGIEEAIDNAEYYRTIEHSLAWEMARALGQVREDVTDIKADTSVIISNQKLAKDYEREIKAVQQSNSASEMELLSLMRFILDRHVPRENIQTELESTYQKLTQLRDSFGDLTSLANEVPEIAPLLKEADEALEAGDGFSLGKAEEALAEADKRYLEIISERDERLKQDKLNRARILIRRAKIAEVKFDYKAAEGFYEAELTFMIEVYGEEHPEIDNSYNNVAYNLNIQGKYKQAEPFFLKALEIRKKNLGENDPKTAENYNALAFNINAQGRCKEAEPLYRKALKIRKHVLGEDDPDTATSYNNVAYNLEAQGSYKEAETLYRKALEIRERILGDEHPDTAASYNNFGSILVSQGKINKVEHLYRRALEIKTFVLGEDNTSTATSYNNLAYILTVQENYEEAEIMARKALEILERLLGEEYPNTLLYYQNLACNLEAQGRYDEAEPLYRKALEIFERVLGEEHPDTVLVYKSLVFNLNDQGKHEEAEEIRKKLGN